MRALAIGLGCRRGCPADAIVALVTRARIGHPGPARLYTIADKAAEPGLQEAARRLGLDLGALSRKALAAAMPGVLTPSPAAAARFGVASVSEAAALAGAGAGARLVVPRLSADGATCAIAIGEGP